MAQPQTEDGFVMLALDLFVALMTSDLPNADAIVLCWILVQSYGPHKRRDVYLEPAEIETATGLHRNNVRAAIRSLETGGYIVRNANGTHRFSKDWESYQPSGRPFVDRLGGGLKRYALWVLTNPLFNVKRKAATPRKRANTSTSGTIQRDCQTKEFPNPTGLSNEGISQSREIGTDVYGSPRNGDANHAAKEGCDAPVARAGARASEEFERLDTVVLPDNQRGVGGKASAERITIKTLIDEARTLHGEDVARQVMARSQEILGTFGDDRLDCYLSAIREAAGTTTTIVQPHRWFLKVGKRYLAGDAGPRAKITPKADDRRRREAEAIERAVAELSDPEDD